MGLKKKIKNEKRVDACIYQIIGPYMLYENIKLLMDLLYIWISYTFSINFGFSDATVLRFLH